MDELAAAFFRTHLPSFYRQQLALVLTSTGSESILRRVLPVVDSLLSMISTNGLDAAEVLHDVLKEFLSPAAALPKREALELQSLFHALLCATPKYKEKRRFLQKTQSVLCQLRMECALSTDSQDFRSFFLETLLPRIQKDRDAVETLAEAAELSEEVEALFPVPVLKRAPGSPTSNPAKRTKDSSLQHSPLARQDETLLHIDSQVRSLRRNFSRDARKEVSVKMAPVRVQLTPEHETSCISDSAKALKEVNKQFFYQKKKLSAFKREEEAEFVTPKVLVTDTPKKEETVRGRHVPAFRNIFS